MTRQSIAPLAAIPECTIAQFVCDSPNGLANDTALIDASTERVVTYGELRDDVRRVASGLIRLGVNPGQIVAVFAPNSPDYVALFYGVTSARATITSLNVIHNAAELAYQLADSGARVLVLACDATPALAAAVRKLGLTDVYTVDQVRAAGGDGASAELQGGWQAADVASITYTNAPSDVPMGVMVTHRNLVANLLQSQHVDPLESRDVVVSLMPFCQLYGMVAVNMGLRAGATVVTFPYFKLDWLLGAMARHRVTSAYLVPPVIRDACQALGHFELRPVGPEQNHVAHRTPPRVGRPHLRRPPAVQRTTRIRLDRGCGADPLHASEIRTRWPRWAFPSRTPSAESWMSSLARTSGPGELGEVWIRGPQVMKGYHQNPEVTSRAARCRRVVAHLRHRLPRRSGLPLRRRSLQEAGQTTGAASARRRTAAGGNRGHRRPAQGVGQSCACSPCC